MVSILIRVPNWLGDCVMSIPVFSEVRKAFPSAHIIAAARPNVAPLFTACPAVNEVVLAPQSHAGLLATYRSAKPLRERNISFGVLLTNSFGTALWAALAGVKKRIGFARDLRGILLNCPFRPTPEVLAAHQAEYYLHLLKGIGVDAKLSDPQLSALPAQLKSADAIRARLNQTGPYAVLAPFSAFGGVKDWPQAAYRTAAALIADTFDMDVLVTGGEAQSARCAEICAGHPRVRNAAGTTDLDSFIGLIAGCSLFLGGDSGGAHLSAALGRPTISIFGITEPSRTRALGPRVAILGQGGLITPDLRNPRVAEAARAALEAITPTEVITAATHLLRR